jgi:hypothetical protein
VRGHIWTQKRRSGSACSGRIVGRSEIILGPTSQRSVRGKARKGNFEHGRKVVPIRRRSHQRNDSRKIFTLFEMSYVVSQPMAPLMGFCWHDNHQCIRFPWMDYVRRSFSRPDRLLGSVRRVKHQVPGKANDLPSFWI